METFLGNGRRMHMLFNFYVNQHLFLALARADISPLIESLQSLPVLQGNNQWLNFLRHHDELSLKVLNDDERREVFEEFAPDEQMRIYGRGIRRRLSSMLAGDMDKMKLAFSLMFSLPGVPLIRYGDEICMGDDLSLPGRTSVRTPMQWSPQINAGFSKARLDKLVHPIIEDGEFSYKKMNVVEAQQDESSFLNWLERLINTRKQCCEIGSGKFEVRESDNCRVFIHSCKWNDEEVVFIHNLSNETIKVDKAKTGIAEEILFTLLAEIKTCEENTFVLEGYGFRWYRVSR